MCSMTQSELRTTAMYEEKKIGDESIHYLVSVSLFPQTHVETRKHTLLRPLQPTLSTPHTKNQSSASWCIELKFF